VVGDAEDVEARTPVEVDELAQGELAVAPGRVGMQLTEKRPVHVMSVRRGRREMGNGVVKVVRKSRG
jgi:hypothetical protein